MGPRLALVDRLRTQRRAGGAFFVRSQASEDFGGLALDAQPLVRSAGECPGAVEETLHGRAAGRRKEGLN